MGCCGLVNNCFVMICSIVLIMLAIGGTTPCSSAYFSLEEGSKYEHPLSKWKVGISNEMVGPNQTLTIHCKSKDDDLGERNLNDGQSFEWEFKENLISTTLYWCTFNTHPLNYHAAFQVFWREKGEWLASRCNFKYCFWIARTSGIYIQNMSKGGSELVHTWEH